MRGNSIHPTLKITSFNVDVGNKEHDRLIEFIRKTIESGEDRIVCWQEVDDSLLTKIMRLFPGNDRPATRLKYERESDRILHGETISCYSVIMAFGRVRIEDSTMVAFPKKARLKLRTRAFIFLQTLRGKWRGTSQDHQCLYADVDFRGVKLRVFSAHFRLTYPSDRIRCWDESLKPNIIQGKTIICADLNTIETLPTLFANFVLGGTLKEGLTSVEREQMQTRFSESRLRNEHRFCTTHEDGDQLDHILVPETLRSHERGVYPDRLGSDHHPIWTILQFFT